MAVEPLYALNDVYPLYLPSAVYPLYVIIKQVAEMILEVFKFEGEVKSLTDKADSQFKKTDSNAKLPDFKFVPTKVAIQETVDWNIPNFDAARR
jgi:recombination DNA repair RAD52 pathway protein